MKNKLTKLLGAVILGATTVVPMNCAFTPVKADTNQLNKIGFSQKKDDYETIVKAVDKTLVKHNDPKKVDLQVLVDKSYIDATKSVKQNWWKKIKYNVETFSSKRFENKFGLEFEIDSVKYVELDTTVNDAAYLFTQQKLEYELGEFDALVSFISRPTKGINGLAELRGNHAMIVRNFNEAQTTQHEFSHLVGAKDIVTCDPNWWNDAKEKVFHPMAHKATIMTYQIFKSDKWNKANTIRINKHKNQSWDSSQKGMEKTREYIAKFNKKHRHLVSKVFCYANAYFHSTAGEKLAKYLCLEYQDDWRLRYLYTQILEKKKNPQKIGEMTAQYRRIVRLKPKEAWVYNNIAWTLAHDNGFLMYLGIDTLELAKKSVAMEPTDYSLDTLGFIYYQRREYKKAAECLEKAVKNTHSLGIATRLARLYHKTGDLKNFKRAAKRMFEIDPEEGMIHYNYATALMKRFGKKLTKQERREVLDVAIAGYEIYPSAAFRILLMDAYEFNAENGGDEAFRNKYKKKVFDIVLGGKKQ